MEEEGITTMNDYSNTADYHNNNNTDAAAADNEDEGEGEEDASIL